MNCITPADVKLFFSKIKELYGGAMPTGMFTCKGIRDVAAVTCFPYYIDSAGATGIAPTADGRYIVLLQGTEFKGEATGIEEDIATAFGCPNDFSQSAKAAIISAIPEGSEILIAGISLGGMVAQLLAADKDIKERYIIRRVIAIGSPLISPTKRTAPCVRIIDTGDIVPKLSAASVFLRWLKRKEERRECGGYKTFIGAHALGYVSADCWKDYDAYGEKGGYGSIGIDFGKIRYYRALKG